MLEVKLEEEEEIKPNISVLHNDCPFSASHTLSLVYSDECRCVFLDKIWQILHTAARQFFPYVSVQQRVATGMKVGALTAATTVYLSHKNNLCACLFLAHISSLKRIQFSTL